LEVAPLPLDPGEDELGVDEGVGVFLQAVFNTDLVIGWTWEQPLVRGTGDVAWFYAEATLHVEGMKDRPYRASGVVRRHDDGWRFAMWCGASPE
jgi:ketosteroid isomerase-like protein